MFPLQATTGEASTISRSNSIIPATVVVVPAPILHTSRASSFLQLRERQVPVRDQVAGETASTASAFPTWSRASRPRRLPQRLPAIPRQEWSAGHHRQMAAKEGEGLPLGQPRPLPRYKTSWAMKEDCQNRRVTQTRGVATGEKDFNRELAQHILCMPLYLILTASA